MCFTLLIELCTSSACHDDVSHFPASEWEMNKKSKNMYKIKFFEKKYM